MKSGNYMSKASKTLVMAGIAICFVPAATRAADDDSYDSAAQDGLCFMGGGAPSAGVGWQRCCWSNWGCLTCYDDGVCEMECETDLCCERNQGCNRIDFPEGALGDPEDEPAGRPGRPNLNQLNIDDSPVVASTEGQDSPGGVSDSRFSELILDMGPDTLAPAFEQDGVIDDTANEETEEDELSGDLDEETAEDGSVNPAGICGAGGGASLMFGLMGLVGMQNRNRRRRTGTAQGGTNGRTH